MSRGASQPLRQFSEEEAKELQRVSRASSEARNRHQRAVALIAVAEGKSLSEAAYHTGESVVQFHRRKRRKEVAQLLEALVEKHPTGTIYVAWDNADTHEDDEVEAVLRAASGRLVLLYLPTYSLWLNPIEMLWRPFRQEVTHCELFQTQPALLAAAQEFFDHFNQCPEKILSVIGSHAAEVA